MKLRLLAFLLTLAVTTQGANRILSPRFKSLTSTVNGDWLNRPVLTLGTSDELTIGFDELSHNFHRLTYHLEHCEADWTPSEDIFESNWLEGFNDLQIEDYQNSINTTVLYTHYQLTLPNDRCELPRLQEFSDEVCRGIQAGAEEAKELSQVLESAVGNVIDHAYRQGTKGDISVEARADSQGLTVSIIDNGHPFDPTVQTEGAAIALMRAYAASIGYKRKGGRNILTLTKQL